MSIFVSDSFTEAGTGNIDLNTHTGEIGATWTHHPHINYTQSTVLDRDLDRVFTEQSSSSAYYASGTPPGADYYVEGVFFHTSTIAVNIAVCARMDTTEDTMYLVRLNGGTIWEMRRIVATSALTLAGGTTTNQLPSVGSSKTGRLVVNGDQISFYINGVLEIGPITDTNITAAGKAGVRFAGASSASTGLHFDSVEAGDLTAGSPSFRVRSLRPAIFTPGLAR